MTPLLNLVTDDELSGGGVAAASREARSEIELLVNQWITQPQVQQPN